MPPQKTGIELFAKVFRETPEINAAWQKLELFPDPITDHLDQLRRVLLVMALWMNPEHYPTLGGTSAIKLAKQTAAVHKEASALVDERDKAISRFRARLAATDW